MTKLFIPFLLLLASAVNADVSGSISSTVIHSNTPKDTFYLNENSSTTGLYNIGTLSVAGSTDDTAFKAVISNRYDSSFIEEMYTKTTKYITHNVYMSLKLGTLDNAMGLYNHNNVGNPSIYPPQGVYNYNTQNSVLEYSVGAKLALNYITDNYDVISIVPMLGKQRNLSNRWANYAGYGFDSPYSQVDGEGKNVRGITLSFIRNSQFKLFANYFESSVDINPKKRLSKTEQYLIYKKSPHTASFLVEGKYDYSVHRYGFCSEHVTYAVGAEYYKLDIRNKSNHKLDSTSEGNYMYARYYLNRYYLSPYIIYTEAHKYGKVYSKTSILGLKYMKLAHITLSAEYHKVNSNSWVEAKYPTESSLQSATSVKPFDAYLFNFTYDF